MSNSSQTTRIDRAPDDGALAAQLRRYLTDRDHWRNILYVAIGGYGLAVAFAQPSWRDQTDLAAFVLENQLPAGGAPSWLALLGWVAVALLAWLLLGSIAARLGWLGLEGALGRLSALFLGATLLAFLPVLAIDGIATEQVWLVCCVAAAMALIAWLATTEFLRYGRPVAAQRRSAGPVVDAGLVLAVALAAAYVAFMVGLTLAHHRRFLTFAFDLGIQDQVMYNIVTSGRMSTTLLGASERLYDHFSPLFYLLAPIYALFQDASTLLILQSLALGAGGVAVYLLAKEKTESRSLAVALAAGYLLYPALHGVNTRDFHQIAFATSLLLFSLYFLERRRTVAFLLILLLALLAKEEIALSVAAIGLYILAVKRRPRLGIPVALVGLVYFVVATVWLFPWLGMVGPAESRYADFLIPGKGLIQSLLTTVVANPLYPVTYVLADQGKIVYLVQLLLPVLFLPLLAPLAAWVLAVPALMLTLLVAPHLDYGIGFHYPAHVIPFVFFLSILALQRLNLNARQRPALAASILVVSLAMSFTYGQVITRHGLGLPPSTPHVATLEEFVSAVPREASISTMNNLAPHLSNRKRIYLFPIVADAELILFDSNFEADFWPQVSIDARGEAIAKLLPYLASAEYGLVREEDGVLLLQRGYDTAANPQAIATLLSARYPATALHSADQIMEMADPQASHGVAKVSHGKPPGQEDDVGLAFGPYVQMQPGRYRVTFRLKLDEAGLAGRVATLDIFSHAAGGPMAGRDLDASEFTVSGQYQEFSVDLEIRNPLPDVEYRILHSGLGTLAADGVDVTYVGRLNE